MNNTRRIIFVVITSLLMAALYCQTPQKNINTCLYNFSTQLNNIIPNASTEQNVYSDAWIGYFIPSNTMHFAVGLEGGLTQINMDDLCTAATMMHVSGVPETFAYPTIGLNAKIGGIFIPFDLGVSFFTVDTRNLKELLSGIYMSLFVIGGDIRIPLIQESQYLPCWSIGAGYYFSKGGIGCGSPASGIDLDFETHTLFAQTQISKSFSFITPFIGYRGIFSNSNTNYYWRSADGLTIDGTLTKKGSGSQNVSFENSFTSQIFAGFGLTLGMLQLDTNASYDINHNIWSGGLSIRIQR